MSKWVVSFNSTENIQFNNKSDAVRFINKFRGTNNFSNVSLSSKLNFSLLSKPKDYTEVFFEVFRMTNPEYYKYLDKLINNKNVKQVFDQAAEINDRITKIIRIDEFILSKGTERVLEYIYRRYNMRVPSKLNFSMKFNKYNRFMDNESGSFKIRYESIDGKNKTILATRDFNKLDNRYFRGFKPPALGSTSDESVSNNLIVFDLLDKCFRAIRIKSITSFGKISDELLDNYNINIDMSVQQFVDLLDDRELKLKLRTEGDKPRIIKCTRKGHDYDYNGDYNIIEVYDLINDKDIDIDFNKIIEFEFYDDSFRFTPGYNSRGEKGQIERPKNFKTLYDRIVSRDEHRDRNLSKELKESRDNISRSFKSDTNRGTKINHYKRIKNILSNEEKD